MLNSPESKGFLTLNGQGHFRIHPKIWCLNFKPQYLFNYSSPTKDSWRVQKKTIRAFNLICELLGWGPASAGPLPVTFLREVLRWLRILRQNFARLVSLIDFSMFQNLLVSL